MKLEVEVNVYHHFPDCTVPGRTGRLILAKLNSMDEHMTETGDRLSREIGETRQAVTDLTGRYQGKIDTMQTHIDTLQTALDNGDTKAAQSAADALDALQTEMAAMGSDATPAPAPATNPDGQPATPTDNVPPSSTETPPEG